MLTCIILSLTFGIMLAQCFRFLVLVPSTLFLSLTWQLAGTSPDHGFIFTTLITALCVQLGYLLGLQARQAMEFGFMLIKRSFIADA